MEAWQWVVVGICVPVFIIAVVQLYKFVRFLYMDR